MSPTALLEPSVLPEVLAPTGESFRRLATLEAPGPTVVSCYVRLDLPDRSGNRYRLAAREALRPMADLPLSHPER
ncbi:MAG TPA: hypothetical protein VFN96_00005, partial [Gemmatimonadales bacterium]|nr:hypothetical protein [Gemmatimonadales bacterium]